MKIQFCLGWLESRRSGRNIFKSKAYGEIFSEYLERTSKFTPCEWTDLRAVKEPKPAATRLWLCEREQGAVKQLTSEALADALDKMMVSGTRLLRIAIGPADGFTKADINQIGPDFLWSFGKMTLPHELAAVLAAEQVYRAWTMIRGLPYHCGH